MTMKSMTSSDNNHLMPHGMDEVASSQPSSLESDRLIQEEVQKLSRHLSLIPLNHNNRDEDMKSPSSPDTGPDLPKSKTPSRRVKRSHTTTTLTKTQLTGIYSDSFDGKQHTAQLPSIHGDIQSNSRSKDPSMTRSSYGGVGNIGNYGRVGIHKYAPAPIQILPPCAENDYEDSEQKIDSTNPERWHLTPQDNTNSDRFCSPSKSNNSVSTFPTIPSTRHNRDSNNGNDTFYTKNDTFCIKL